MFPYVQMEPALQPWVTRWLEAEQGRLALWLPVALGVGVLLYFAPRFEPPLWWGGAALLPAGLAAWCRARRPLLAWGLALLACIGAGSRPTGWCDRRNGGDDRHVRRPDAAVVGQRS